jgi:hypothetical protein
MVEIWLEKLDSLSSIYNFRSNSDSNSDSDTLNPTYLLAVLKQRPVG